MSPTPPAGPRRAPLSQRPRLSVPENVLATHGATLLDPSRALTTRDKPLWPTVYVPDVVKVHGLPGRSADRRFEAIRQAAQDEGYTAEYQQGDRELADELAAYVTRDGADPDLVRLVDRYWVSRVVLTPATDTPMRRPDAWRVLQRLRAKGRSKRPGRRVALATISRQTRERSYEDEPGTGLVHVMTSCASMWSGTSWWDGHGTDSWWDGHDLEPTSWWDGHNTEATSWWDGHSTVLASEYGRPGIGARTPVVWRGEDPWVDTPPGRRAPVICIPDTGIGQHPWFTDVEDVPPQGYARGARRRTKQRVVFKNGVAELREYAGLPLGLPNAVETDARGDGVSDDMLGLLDRRAGHGTFIAGLVRQQCPSAKILAVPVMSTDGSIDDVVLQRALVLLLLRQLEGLKSRSADELIDVLSISLGYYHEQPEDLESDAIFGPLLKEFGEAGVVVICAAGNDGTSVPMFPAAFAASARSPHYTAQVPLLSVGATNPDGSTIALYSNGGAWVSAYRPGTAVVSTIPVTFDAGRQAGIRVKSPAGDRASVDSDNFRSGFATWSGTSFATPVLAGQIAQRMVDEGRMSSTASDISKESSVERGWAAVSDELGWRRP